MRKDINRSGSSDIKIFIGIILFTVLLVIGLAFLQGRNTSVEGADDQNLEQVEGIEVTPKDYDLGNVPINGGDVEKQYQLKNTTETVITLQKVVTSCMCTEAKVSVGSNESRFFGMEHPGYKNPSINYEIDPGETATVTVKFDPAAHGPQGIGVFDRIVTLTFNNPLGIEELTFHGTVIR